LVKKENDKKIINFGLLQKKTGEGFEPTTFWVRKVPEGSVDTLNHSAKGDHGARLESLQLID